MQSSAELPLALPPVPFPLYLLFRSCASFLYRSSPVPSVSLIVDFLSHSASSSSSHPTSCSFTFHPLCIRPPAATAIPVSLTFSFSCLTSWTHSSWVENGGKFTLLSGQNRFGMSMLSRTSFTPICKLVASSRMTHVFLWVVDTDDRLNPALTYKNKKHREVQRRTLNVCCSHTWLCNSSLAFPKKVCQLNGFHSSNTNNASYVVINKMRFDLSWRQWVCYNVACVCQCVNTREDLLSLVSAGRGHITGLLSVSAD